MKPGPGEPLAGPWHRVSTAELAGKILDGAEVRAPQPADDGKRPHIVAVDGRSGGGKTTFADRLAGAVPRSAVVHVDDVAWHAPMFEWTELLATGVLEPLRRGEAVSYRPPAWMMRDRPGAIDVPAGLELVVVEGVGAGRRELTDLIDVLVWVQSDYAEAERLGIARDIESGVNGDMQATVDFWRTWMAAEVPFLERDRPWERATIIVAGTSAHSRANSGVEASFKD
ncbi:MULTISPECIES: uridine kinase family protein [unclassified Kribbella]|uniref:uridine kinase family protein n=1 Tax=unclassified Kribbella TaxID=2644121 RepID=UPI0030779D28